jgi:hypothetical protein
MPSYLPLIVNAGAGQIQELPAGDDLNIANANIANAVNITATGNVSGGNLTLTGNAAIGLNSTSIANVQASLKVGTNARERITISATAAANTINYDVIDQGVLYYTANASANWTLNLRANSTITLDQYLATGESITVAFLATNGATPYYQSNFQVDASNVTPKWQGAVAPTSGNANNIDVYVINAIKTGANAFTVLESVTKFG